MTGKIIRYLQLIAPVALGICVASCTQKQTPDALASVDTEILTKTELSDAMPFGLSAADSAKFADAYIRNWIDDKLIDHIAARNITDVREIDRLAKEYRRQLILHEYRQQMAQAYAESDFPEDTLRNWYDLYGKSLRTTAPLIKGIFLKLPAESPLVKDARRLVRSRKQADIDRLERTVSPEAADYEYFRDRWSEWSRLEAKIPAVTGSDGDSWLRFDKTLDMTSGGFTYLLDITEYLPTGSQMPFEIARPVILEKFKADSRLEYDRRLRDELYDKALAEGKIVIY